MSKLDEARKRIGEIDKEMAELFEERMHCAELVAEFKKEFALPIFDAKREKELLVKNSGYIKDDVIREYYTSYQTYLMNLSKNYQNRIINSMRVAYSGVEGAFAQIAADKMFNGAALVPCKDFEAAYNKVVNGEADAVVLPIENSFAGDVGAVMDLIFSGSLYINQMLDLSVVHNLVAKKGTKKSEIKTVYSHPQALSQCAQYIEKHFFDTVDTSNTALAAKEVAQSDDLTIAAIASAETAALYGLDVIDERINTSANNTTRFAAFSRSLNNPSPSVKMGEHFILVFTVINEAGALAKTLNIIGAHGFNMRNLRSRPMKDLMWNYYFYVELDGNVNTEDGRDMLRQLNTVCDRLKLVGSYFTQAEK